MSGLVLSHRMSSDFTPDRSLARSLTVRGHLQSTLIGQKNRVSFTQDINSKDRKVMVVCKHDISPMVGGKKQKQQQKTGMPLECTVA